MSGRVQGKVAIVTGAAAGQGQAHMRLLAREGAFVVGVDVNGQGGLETLESVREEGGDGHFIVGDIGTELAWESVIDWVRGTPGRVDVLVNNAGIIRVEGFLEETLDGWNELLRINQTGIFLGMRAVLPLMIEQGGGSIINISSNMGIAAMLDHAAYHAAKAAIILMSKNAAVSHGPQGIRVNTVCPGMVWTAMSEGHDANEPMIAVTPLRRGAEPEEISPAVLFLASDESRFITGSEIVVDGGYLAQ